MADIFNKNKKTIIERGKHIKSTINQIEINKDIRKMIDNGNSLEGTPLGEHLDNITNYFLESQDVKSGRKIENTFYRDERYYSSHYAMGKNAINITNNELETLEGNSKFDNSNLDINYIKRLFNPEKLSEDDIRRFIVSGCNYTRTVSDDIRGGISWLWEEIMSNCTDREREIIKMFDGKRTAKEISGMQSVSDRYIRKILKNVSKKTIKWFRFAK
ncbi:MAG: hypothetical protein ABF991_00810 [Liquorilactobacillus hordei]|uniref:helix-turn-helix transcriptional regulator n=1 Tax=Liquorilactobacillus hordei TaxID=468911 RepID=UPI0039EBECB3